jgi:hypothetical protein
MLHVIYWMLIRDETYRRRGWNPGTKPATKNT